MVKAGQEEKNMAITKKEMFEGVPAISVTVDGGWSKRPHKHSYNAKSGVAVIIGNATRKLLYLVVRNKYCSICTVALNKGSPPSKHRCYRNWDGSSCAICWWRDSGQQQVRYMHMTGDGDSSVLANREWEAYRAASWQDTYPCPRTTPVATTRAGSTIILYLQRHQILLASQ